MSQDWFVNGNLHLKHFKSLMRTSKEFQMNTLTKIAGAFAAAAALSGCDITMQQHECKTPNGHRIFLAKDHWSSKSYLEITGASETPQVLKPEVNFNEMASAMDVSCKKGDPAPINALLSGQEITLTNNKQLNDLSALLPAI